MLSGIVSWALSRRGIVMVLALMLFGYGIYSLTTAQYDILPNFAPAEVTLKTEAPGLSAGQVETLVTQPIENTINGSPGIAALRSTSIQGFSSIVVVFQFTTHIYRIREILAQRLVGISSILPAGVQTPILSPPTSSAGTVMAVALTSRAHSLMDVQTAAYWTVRPRLLAVPGVANIAVFGRSVRQIQIQYDPEKLIQRRLTVAELLAAAKHATGVLGAGFIDTPNQRLVLQSQAQTTDPEAIAGTVLARVGGRNVTIGDVARVVAAPAPAFGAASIDGRPCVLLLASSQPGTNTLAVTARLSRALAELQPALAAEKITLHTNLFRPASFVLTALRNIRSALFIGAILVVIVLFLFLFDLRTAAISCVAIPLSLLTATLVLSSLGYSLNVMTLGGLAIAIGEVVDDAVIDVENILRRLRENRSSASPRPIFRVVLDASLEVRSAVVYATFAVVLVFLPVLAISGLAGRIFAPLGVAYISSILASLAVALTVTPAMCLLLLGKRELAPHDPPLVAWAKRLHRPLLAMAEKWSRTVMVVVGMVILGVLLLLPRLRSSFIPQLQGGYYVVHFQEAPGASLGETLRIGTRITKAFMKLPFVQVVTQRAGRGELASEARGVNASEIDIKVDPSYPHPESIPAQLRRVAARFPGLAISTETFLTERFHDLLSGFTQQVAVEAVGNNLDELDQAAVEIAATLRKIPGATGVQIQAPPSMPQIEVDVRRRAAERWGLDPVQVLQAVSTAYQGDSVGKIFQGNQVFDVAVWLAPDERNNVADLASLPLRTPDGNYVSLGQVARVYADSGRYMIYHEGGRRVQPVTCDVTGRNVASFVAEAQIRIAQLHLPAGVYAQFLSTAAAAAQARRDLLVDSILAGIGIVLLLSIVLTNYRNLFLVLLNLPFALVGGVLAAWLFNDRTLSLGSLVGFVTLFGITVRNAIMLISHYEHLVAVEGMDWGPEAAVRGALERLSPILMTALVTGLGLLPLALAGGRAGAEIEGPMAIVILGGLFTSTALNLLVLPALALRFGRFEPPSDT
ncbi:MAG TPA: efflux RND transporter permease subunit [Candidatus Dormibacteraeota bacterium]|nr:efflux RND transporter permease subunit [Candidatus Dormibacteraeota bacterium]